MKSIILKFTTIFMLLAVVSAGCNKSNESDVSHNENDITFINGNDIPQEIECECENEIDNNSDIHDYIIDDVLYPKNAKLKQTSNGYGNIWNVNAVYEYDDLGRISKVSRLRYDGSTEGYNVYEYNNKNQLEEIKYYNEFSFNFKTEIYSYDKDGNKIRTLIDAIIKTDSILYFYEGNRLIQENRYDSGIHFNGSNPTPYTGLISYIKYAYDSQGNLCKWAIYAGINNAPTGYSVYSYQNGLNIKTEVFAYFNVFGKTKSREIRHYYDKNDNLIYLESQELAAWSSALSYTSKYEYY